jgi:uncharacterized membrane protein YphA (DoxX/SURF4 family)
MEKHIILLLRISIAFTLLYAAISGFIDPNAWIGFLPSFATAIMPAETILIIFGVIEILAGLGLLLMKNPFYPAVLSAILVSGIIVFNIPQLSILFRDVPIVLMSIALALHYNYKNKEEINYE